MLPVFLNMPYYTNSLGYLNVTIHEWGKVWSMVDTNRVKDYGYCALFRDTGVSHSSMAESNFDYLG